MPLYLLDTDHMTLLQRGGEPMERLRKRLRALAPDDFGTTIVSYEEQIRGWLAVIAGAQKREVELGGYRRLAKTLIDFSGIAVWQYDEKAADIYDALKQQRVRIGTKDLKIAAIALAQEATILTRNFKDFSKVPNLKVEDWTA